MRIDPHSKMRIKCALKMRIRCAYDSTGYNAHLLMRRLFYAHLVRILNAQKKCQKMRI